jgi:hypothetical protein
MVMLQKLILLTFYWEPDEQGKETDDDASNTRLTFTGHLGVGWGAN